MNSKNFKAFTVVEILIVVVVLGILAAIVIPQFSSASSEARESYLANSLNDLRSQIDLYKVHHNGLLPGEQGTGASDIDSFATETTFKNALTNKTNARGKIGVGSEYIYGPYISSIPANPFSSQNADIVEIDGKAGNGDHGWHLTTKGPARGLLQADDAGYNVFTHQLHSTY